MRRLPPNHPVTARVRSGGVTPGVAAGRGREGDGVTVDVDAAVRGVEAAVVTATEQHGVVDRQVSPIGEGLPCVSDVAPPRWGVAARPDAPLIAHLQRTPQPQGHRAHGRGYLHRGTGCIHHQTEELAVVDQMAQVGTTDRLARGQQPSGGVGGIVLQAGELLRREHHDHLGTHTVLGRRLPGPQRDLAQLLERIRGSLFGSAVLTGGVGAAEGPECHPGLLSSGAVEQSGEDEATVRDVGGPQPPRTMLAGRVAGEPGGPDSSQHLAGHATEGHGIVLRGQGQQLGLHPASIVLVELGQDPGDQLRLGRFQLPVLEGLTRGRVGAGCLSSLDDTLGLRPRHALLIGELSLVFPPRDRTWAPTRGIDTAGLGHCSEPGTDPFQLPQGSRQAAQHFLKGSLVDRFQRPVWDASQVADGSLHCGHQGPQLIGFPSRAGGTPAGSAAAGVSPVPLINHDTALTCPQAWVTS